MSSKVKGTVRAFSTYKGLEVVIKVNFIGFLNTASTLIRTFSAEVISIRSCCM